MRITHEPTGYRCPFCDRLAGKADEVSGPEDIVRRTDDAAAFISPRWWPNNPGHVYRSPPRPGWATFAERQLYAERLRTYFAQ